MQRLARDPDWQINHVAILDKKIAGEWHVVEADVHGVTGTRTDRSDHHNRSLSDIARNGTYEIRPVPLGADPSKVIQFARAQVGDEYGFLTILSILITLISPKFINLMLPNTWICSALAAESFRFAGWLHNWSDIYQVRPSQLREEAT